MTFGIAVTTTIDNVDIFDDVLSDEVMLQFLNFHLRRNCPNFVERVFVDQEDYNASSTEVANAIYLGYQPVNVFILVCLLVHIT